MICLNLFLNEKKDKKNTLPGKKKGRGKLWTLFEDD